VNNAHKKLNERRTEKRVITADICIFRDPLSIKSLNTFRLSCVLRGRLRFFSGGRGFDDARFLRGWSFSCHLGFPFGPSSRMLAFGLQSTIILLNFLILFIVRVRGRFRDAFIDIFFAFPLLGLLCCIG
jgi:hypothetical protein